MKNEEGFSKITIIVVVFILVLIIIFSRTSGSNNSKNKNILNEENKVAYQFERVYTTTDDINKIDLNYNDINATDDSISNIESMRVPQDGINIDDIEASENDLQFNLIN